MCALSGPGSSLRESSDWDIEWVLGMGREGLTRLDLRLGGRILRGASMGPAVNAELRLRPRRAGHLGCRGHQLWPPAGRREQGPRWRPWAGQVDDQMSQTQAETVFWEKYTARPIFPFGSKSQVLAWKVHKQAGSLQLRRRGAGEGTAAVTLCDTFFFHLLSTAISHEKLLLYFGCSCFILFSINFFVL